MWLPGSSPFIPENKGTTLLSLRCLPPRCMLPVLEAVLLQGEGTSPGLAFRKLPWGNGAGLHSPAAHTLGEVWKHAPTCPAENPSRKQENGESLLQSIAFHILLFFTSDPKMGQCRHNSETQKTVQRYTRNPSFAHCFSMLTVCRGSASCLCITLITIKQYFERFKQNVNR